MTRGKFGSPHLKHRAIAPRRTVPYMSARTFMQLRWPASLAAGVLAALALISQFVPLQVSFGASEEMRVLVGLVNGRLTIMHWSAGWIAFMQEHPEAPGRLTDWSSWWWTNDFMGIGDDTRYEWHLGLPLWEAFAALGAAGAIGFLAVRHFAHPEGTRSRCRYPLNGLVTCPERGHTQGGGPPYPHQSDLR